jgi:hypothetical protein
MALGVRPFFVYLIQAKGKLPPIVISTEALAQGEISTGLHEISKSSP